MYQDIFFRAQITDKKIIEHDERGSKSIRSKFFIQFRNLSSRFLSHFVR